VTLVHWMLDVGRWVPSGIRMRTSNIQHRTSNIQPKAIPRRCPLPAAGETTERRRGKARRGERQGARGRVNSGACPPRSLHPGPHFVPLCLRAFVPSSRIRQEQHAAPRPGPRAAIIDRRTPRTGRRSWSWYTFRWSPAPARSRRSGRRSAERGEHGHARGTARPAANRRTPARSRLAVLAGGKPSALHGLIPRRSSARCCFPVFWLLGCLAFVFEARGSRDAYATKTIYSTEISSSLLVAGRQASSVQGW
jgi:hypothetical protein